MANWTHLPGLSPYMPTLSAMEAHVAAMAEGRADEAVWLLEHPPLYTAGTSARETDLVQPDRFPVFDVGRGGQYFFCSMWGPAAATCAALSARWKTG